MENLETPGKIGRVGRYALLLKTKFSFTLKTTLGEVHAHCFALKLHPHEQNFQKNFFDNFYLLVHTRKFV